MPPVLDLIAGARPNFMKLAPVVRALEMRRTLDFRIVHTGQHYAEAMSDVFFKELGIPAPTVHLDVGSGSHGAQTARILERYEAHALEHRPSATVVFGDVNSTVACALAAVKLGIPVVHVEAGLRSFDRAMPEEINRILTDAMSDLLLVSEPAGLDNLKREGHDDAKVHLVGNVMIDTLMTQLPTARARATLQTFGVEPKNYGLVTMHRPSNVDDPRTLRVMLELLTELSRQLPLIFPVHPRTRASAERLGIDLSDGSGTLKCVGPLPYLDTLALTEGARIVLTDSGGLQEETTVLGVPCLTLRENTERPITVTRGSSRLVGSDPGRIRAGFDDVLHNRWRSAEAIPFWDGQAGSRVAAAMEAWLGVSAATQPSQPAVSA